MKRGKPAQAKTPDLILTSDWHLREDTPVCRTDDFWEAQWKKVQYIAGLSFEHKCDVIHAGDLFNHWKPSPFLLTSTLINLPAKFRFKTVYGQHDLPQHNLNLEMKCGIRTLAQTDKAVLLKAGHFGQEPRDVELHNRKIAVWHKLIWPKKSKPSWSDDPTAEEILEKYPQYDLIVTGDNHQSFVWKTDDGRLLVNPGSITRQTADQENHKPCVYLWYAETNTVEPVYLPIESGVISREHIERKKSRDKRIEAFVERLNEEWEVKISFTTNLEAFQKKNKVRQEVMDIIWKAVEG